jgi:tonB family protein
MADEQLKYTDFEELVFEDRNKEYGAYDLRRSYKWFLTKAFILGTAIFVAAIILPFIYVTSTEGEKVKETQVDIDLLQHIEAPEDKPEEDKPKEDEEIHESKPNQQSIQDLAQRVDDIPPQATVQDLLPDPKRGAKNETQLLDQGNKDTNTGTKNIEGTKDTNYQGDQRRDGVEGGQGNHSRQENTEVVKEKVDLTQIHSTVDVDADFSVGGIDGFRNRVRENFDTEAVEGEGVLTTTVSFVVEIDGSITQVKATGANADFNREAERVIRSIKTKWKPGKKGNQNVRSRFRFPLTMKFE